MVGMPDNIQELLSRLKDSSRNELELVRELGEAIRRVDDQLLSEVRNVTMLHALRREAIFGELQTLAARMCSLPAGAVLKEPLAVTNRTVLAEEVSTVEIAETSRGGDWREATERINAELEEYFSLGTPRH